MANESTLFRTIQLYDKEDLPTLANQLKSIGSSMEFLLPSTEFRQGERKAESLAGSESSNGSTFFCFALHRVPLHLDEPANWIEKPLNRQSDCCSGGTWPDAKCGSATTNLD